MRANDKQIAKPNVVYKNTKSNIEAMNPVAGSIAFATDTQELGYYNGVSWVWGTESSAGGGVSSAVYAYLSSDVTIGNNVWTKLNPAGVSTNYGSHYSTSTYRWTPPAGWCIIAARGYFHSTNTSGIRLAVYKSGSSITQLSERNNVWHIGYTCGAVDYANGTDYYELYAWRWNGGVHASGVGGTFLSAFCLED